MNIREVIVLARQFLAEGDPHLANYVLRDRPEVAAAGLSDLAWATHRGNPHRNDVLAFIRDLEDYLAKAGEDR